MDTETANTDHLLEEGSSRTFKNEEEVQACCKAEGKKLVIFNSIVYDVAEYMPGHPGGDDKIKELLGSRIDTAFEEAEHSHSAR